MEDELFTPRPKKYDPLFTKHQLKELVENGVVTVVFTKIDGTERTMHCTLLAEHLPKQDTAKLLIEKTNRNENENVMSVWDCDNNGWRSFRVDSVLRIGDEV